MDHGLPDSRIHLQAVCSKWTSCFFSILPYPKDRILWFLGIGFIFAFWMVELCRIFGETSKILVCRYWQALRVWPVSFWGCTPQVQRKTSSSAFCNFDDSEPQPGKDTTWFFSPSCFRHFRWMIQQPTTLLLLLMEEILHHLRLERYKTL